MNSKHATSLLPPYNSSSPESRTAERNTETVSFLASEGQPSPGPLQIRKHPVPSPLSLGLRLQKDTKIGIERL